MRAVFPGKPQAQLQACDTALWDGRRITTYISGRALIILDGTGELVQTISHSYDDDDDDDDDDERDTVDKRKPEEKEEKTYHGPLLGRGHGHHASTLTAVAINDISGKIAVSTMSTVHVYKPIGQDVGALKWTLQHTLPSASGESCIACVSWGPPDELLVGGLSLTMYLTDRDTPMVWTRPMANAAKLATFSPDGTLIAKTGWRDRTVKVLRRQFFGEGHERFDVSYLPHPKTVTGLRWRGRPDKEQHVDLVLYTTCADHVLRIWAATDPHGTTILQLWAKIDLLDCLQPRTPLSPGQELKRFVLVVDNWEFKAATAFAAEQTTGTEREIYTRVHLRDVTLQNPELCIILDDRGNMSAWGLERVGCKDRQAKDIFNITNTEDLNLDFRHGGVPLEQHLSGFAFDSRCSKGSLSILTHFYDGRLEWIQCPIDRLLDPSPILQRLTVKASWTGHASSVTTISASPNQKILTSRSANGEAILWKPDVAGTTMLATPITAIHPETAVDAIYPINDGRSVIVMSDDKASIVSLEQSIEGERSRISLPPRTSSLKHKTSPISVFYPKLCSDSKTLLVWRVEHDKSKSPQLWVRAKLDVTSDEALYVPRPAISPKIPNVICCASISVHGTVKTWVLPDRSIDTSTTDLKPINSFDTGLTTHRTVVLGPRNLMAILSDTKTSFYIWQGESLHQEFHKTFESYETIEALEWTASDSQVLLAVVFPRRVIFYAQNRFDLPDPENTWIPLHQLDISEKTTLPITASAWLANGDFMVAAGNQIFVFDHKVPISRRVSSGLGIDSKSSLNPEQDLLTVASALNYTLPLYHPSYLTQCVQAGKIDAIQLILGRLNERLKFFSEGDKLEANLGLEIFTDKSTITNSKLPNGTSQLSRDKDDDEAELQLSLTPEHASALKDRIEANQLPFLSAAQKSELSLMVEIVGSIGSQRRSLDALAQQYVISLRYQSLLREDAALPAPILSWREIVWAFFSSKTDILVTATTQEFKGKVQWEQARQTGMFMWIRDHESLKAQFEVVARNEYTKTESRNPVDCSLHYLALRKKSMLLSLWRMTAWHKERTATHKLLSNNFEDPRWKTAALKNAYALLGRRRFEYAAAFFLLADRLKDAVNVLAGELKDIQLAIAVVRVYDGDESPILASLLRERILPYAAQTGNRWMAVWAFWMLKQREKALSCFVSPLHSLIPVSQSPPPSARLWTTDEPSLAYSYAQIRDICALDPRNRVALSPADEARLVRRSARLYIRTGCPDLALDLVRTWRFSKGVATSAPSMLVNGYVNGMKDVVAHALVAKAGAGESVGLPSKEREISDQSPSEEEFDTEVKAGSAKEEDEKHNEKAKDNGAGSVKLHEYKNNTKKVLVEPDAASIFDNFDF